MLRRMFKNFPSMAALLFCGCSSITMMDGTEGKASDKTCDMRVFQTHAQALKGGPIEELCIITGDSSFSFVHTTNVAIERHKSKACACGASALYVESRSPPGGWNGPASVSMVAFRYVNAPQSSSRPSPTPVGSAQSSQPTGTVATTNVETEKVIQFLSDNGFPLVGEPVRFKQKGNLNFYNAIGAGNKAAQVVCDANACGFRTIND